MYFEAVEEVLNKLADPNIKSATKLKLTRELQDLDGDGKIRKFLEGSAERPDLSRNIDASSTR